MRQIVVLVLAAYGALAGTWALLGRSGPEPAAATADAPAAALDRELLTRARELFRADLRPVLLDVEERLRAIERLQVRIGESLAEAEAIVESTQRTDAGAIARALENLGPLRSGVEEQRLRLGGILKSIEEMTTRIQALEERPAVIREVAGPGAAPVVEPGPRVPTLPDAADEDPRVSQAAIAKALADLQETELAVVFKAIEAVRKYRVMAAVPRLGEIMATSKTTFARQAAAAALGDLEACDAVPALLDALLDEESVVAQQAFRSMRAITGFAEELDPLARIRERRRMRGVAQQWWRMHEKEVRERLGQAGGAEE
jgi:hypothetical protein